MIVERAEVDYYFMPDDRIEAEAQFLAMLHDPWETFISAYGFTLKPLFDEILRADANGVPIHILLDHTQFKGHTEYALVVNMIRQLRTATVTVCTSSISGKIWHDKVMVTRSKDRADYRVWWGSVNFSESGFEQGNVAACFDSKSFGPKFIERFEKQEAWARQHQPQYQVQVISV